MSLDVLISEVRALPADARRKLMAFLVSLQDEGDANVSDPVKSNVWPEKFFDSIHITDPAFVRPEQGQSPPVKNP
jgi:hypothetical protein